jgi:nucleotide-binding universal stress UspA family protein
MEFRKILVALDTGEKGRADILDGAVAMAEKFKARLMLFHCLPQTTPAELEDRVGAQTELVQAGGLEKMRHKTSAEREHVRAWLEEKAKELSGKGIEADTAVEIGSRKKAIVEMADRWSADLVVLGRTKRSSLGDFITDSISNHVLHHASCSVLFVD